MVDKVRASKHHSREIKKLAELAFAAKSVQAQNGAGQGMDKTLREFLIEYNGRIGKYGRMMMPSSFNVMHPFFRFMLNPVYIRLRDESDHLFSFPEFIDHVTSIPSEPPSTVLDSMEEGKIYSFNVTNAPGELTFSSSGGQEFGIGGASLVRDGSTIFVLLLAGQVCDVSLIETIKTTSVQISPDRGDVAPDPKLKAEAVPLFGDPSLWRCLYITGFDLANSEQLERFIAWDRGNGYTLLTDNSASFFDSDRWSDEQAEAMAKRAAEEIGEYDALLEVCKTALLLPLYFEKFGELVKVERHPTEYHATVGKFALRKRNSRAPKELKKAYRQVFELERRITHTPDQTTIVAPEYRIETSGYWKNLSQGSFGQDRAGNQIHGKTWVEKRLAWRETQRTHVTARRRTEEASSEDAGFVYVMRTAAHPRDVFKVGETSRTPTERAQELTRSTSSLDAFLVVEYWQVPDRRRTEKEIHTRLDDYRVNPRREFFRIQYDELRRIVVDVIGGHEPSSG